MDPGPSPHALQCAEPEAAEVRAAFYSTENSEEPKIRTKSYKDKVMGPNERRTDGGFPTVPGVIFTNWRESLNAAALPGAVRAG